MSRADVTGGFPDPEQEAGGEHDADPHSIPPLPPLELRLNNRNRPPRNGWSADVTEVAGPPPAPAATTLPPLPAQAHPPMEETFPEPDGSTFPGFTPAGSTPAALGNAVPQPPPAATFAPGNAVPQPPPAATFAPGNAVPQPPPAATFAPLAPPGVAPFAPPAAITPAGGPSAWGLPALPRPVSPPRGPVPSPPSAQRRTSELARTAPVASPLLPAVGSFTNAPPAPPPQRTRPAPPPTSRRRGILVVVLAATVLLVGGAATVVLWNLNTPGPTDPVRLPLPSDLIEVTDGAAAGGPTVTGATPSGQAASVSPSMPTPSATPGATRSGATPTGTVGPGPGPGGPVDPTLGPTTPPTSEAPPPTTKGPPPPPTLTATYRTLYVSPLGGYTGEVTVANPGPGDATGWQVTLKLPDGQTVDDAVGAGYSQDGGRVNFYPAGSKGLADGGSATFSFTVSGGNSPPTGCAIDGHAC